METIQVVLDSKLLRATDVAARRTTESVGAGREALRAHLKKLEIQELELRDRKGYKAALEIPDSYRLGIEAIWPEE
jgi:hypothetical protein